MFNLRLKNSKYALQSEYIYIYIYIYIYMEKTERFNTCKNSKQKSIWR